MARITHPRKECTISRIQIGPIKYCASFLVIGRARYNNLSFILDQIALCDPHYWIPKNFMRERALEFWVDLVPSSDTLMYYEQVQSGCYFMLSWFNQHKGIDIVYQCDIFV